MLVEAARIMLIFSRAPLFLWDEAIATACYTQNRSIIHRRFDKTPYELINGRKPDISFLHVFGALCYPKNDREDIGKLGAKSDIGFFIGYSANSRAYRIAYVQEEIVEGSNAPNETGNVQRTLRTSSSGNTLTVQCYNCSGKGHYARNYPKPRVQDSKYFMEQMLLAKQDEAGVILTDEHNDFLFADASRMEEIEELSANICLMARIQPAIITLIIEKDTHVPDLCALEQLARNAYQEAEKQQIFAQKVQKQNTTLTSQLELYKERVWVLENINGDNNYLNEFLKADKRAKHFSQQAQSQFVRDRDIIRDLEKQRDKLDLDVKDYKRKNEELQKTHSILKRQMSENKDRYHDTVLDLEAKLKKNVDLILKLGNSLQGMFMLGPKPLSVYDQQLKHGLGYLNPYTLKQPISQCLKLYLASSLGNSEISLNVRDTEDTLDDASKSQQKVYEKMNDPIAVANKQNCWTIDYAQINALYKDFVPQKELSAEQKYFPSSFIPSDKNSNETLSIPASMPNLLWIGDSGLSKALMTGDDLLTGSRESNLYTISISDMATSSPVCLMSKATLTKSWLWHRRLLRLNFGTINDLTRLDLVNGLPKYTWVYFLHSKDETPEIIKKFIAQAQLNYKAKVCKIRTDNGTEFKNATLKAHYEKLGIMQQFSTARTPQQNGVVERRNRTLVVAARTMLIFSRLPEFIWAEAVATACFTQNRSIIHTRHNKTPYELLRGRKPNVEYFHVFGSLCYPTNDRDDLGKMKPKADIGVFIGYSETSRGFQIYNRRTKKIMETIHVKFDELTAMASEHDCLEPELQRFINHNSSAETMNTPSKEDLDNLFGPMYEEYFEKKFSDTPINSAAQPTQIHEDSPSTSSIIVDEHEAPPIVTTSDEQTSPISLTEADEIDQEDSADFDGNSQFVSYNPPSHEKDYHQQRLRYHQSAEFHELKTSSSFKTTGLLQSWQTLCKIFSKCLTTRVTGWDQPPLQIMQMMYCFVNNIHIDYAELLWEALYYSLHHPTSSIPYPRFTKIIISHYMTSFPEISKRARDRYHNLKDDDIMKNIFNLGRYKDKVGMKIPDWMILEEMKHTEHYRMYAEVFGLDVPLTQS
ncbi:retrovirus-related pol polyprotein from transposon TNT 1-94 [Tanacetum coccineum]|uniref:Retrovirus-related pol polyprotein from transposon TNT 1-94 n=1 Tax=Tanacetum coccineum TaxID=301880 RepID=A0ABQ5AEY6_9ASTR